MLPSVKSGAVNTTDLLEIDDAGEAFGASPDLDRYVSETTAAHAAVVLAKTQATAARAEARDLITKIRRLTEELEAERTEHDRTTAALDEASRAQAILERDKAVAEARADEVRSQIDQERVERSVLAARLGELESDRENALTSMGWWSRRRYDQRRG